MTENIVYHRRGKPKHVFVITKWSKEKPEFMMPVAVLSDSNLARRWIEKLPGFECWKKDISRIAECGDELYEFTEFDLG